MVYNQFLVFFFVFFLYCSKAFESPWQLQSCVHTIFGKANVLPKGNLYSKQNERFQNTIAYKETYALENGFKTIFNRINTIFVDQVSFPGFSKITHRNFATLNKKKHKHRDNVNKERKNKMNKR